MKKDIVTVKRSVEKGSLTCQQAGKRFEVKPWGFPCTSPGLTPNPTLGTSPVLTKSLAALLARLLPLDC